MLDRSGLGRASRGTMILCALAIAANSAVDAQVCTTAPTEARSLNLSVEDPTHLSWLAPVDSGGSPLILYDVLRSATPGDFSNAQCLASGLAATAFDESGFTGNGYYLVRSRNACGNSLGARSNGVPRTGATCIQNDGGQCFANSDCVTAACCGGYCRNTETNIDHCGGCDLPCVVPNGAPSCLNGMCSIAACLPAFADCDGSPATGCECSGTTCCLGACAPTHVNGLGQTFDSCLPSGVPGNPATYTFALAQAARAAWPVPGPDSGATCGSGGNAAAALVRQTATSCAVWVYQKTTAGYVHLNSVSNSCVCPTTSDPVWF